METKSVIKCDLSFPFEVDKKYIMRGDPPPPDTIAVQLRIKEGLRLGGDFSYEKGSQNRSLRLASLAAEPVKMQLEHKSRNLKDRNNPDGGFREDAIIGEKKWHFDKPGCGTGRVTIFWKHQTLDLEAAGFTAEVTSDRICPDASLKVNKEISFYETHPDCLDVYEFVGVLRELVTLGIMRAPSISEEARTIVNEEVATKLQGFLRGRCWQIQ